MDNNTPNNAGANNTAEFNKALEEAILKVKTDKTPQAQDAFLNVLVRSRLITPVTIDPPPTEKDEQGRIQIPKNSKITFHLMKNAQGTIYYPVFSHWDEVRKGPHAQDQNTLVLPFKEIANLIIKNPESAEGFVLNPFSDGLVMPKQLIEGVMNVIEKAMKDQKPGLTEMKVGTDVKLGDFKNPPQEIIDKLTEYFDESCVVSTAYLLAMMHEDKNSFLVVVEHSGEKEKVYFEIGNIIKPFAGDRGIAITDCDSDLGKKAMIGRFPFYER